MPATHISGSIDAFLEDTVLIYPSDWAESARVAHRDYLQASDWLERRPDADRQDVVAARDSAMRRMNLYVQHALYAALAGV